NQRGKQSSRSAAARVGNSMDWKEPHKSIKVFGSTVGVRALRRRQYVLTAVPIQHLEQQSSGFWRSVGDDPIFELQSTDGFPCGWVHIQIEIDFSCSDSKLYPSIYVNSGRGYSEATRLRLVSPQAGRIDMIRRLPNRVIALRFDPAERPCE